MKRELGLARCGLACCLCSENEHCAGCHSDECRGKDFCQNRKCSVERCLSHCFECENEDCRKGLLSKIKPLGFTQFARKYGMERLMECLELNEQKGVIYHRSGIVGDYDEFDNVDDLLRFIETGGADNGQAGL